MKASPPRPVAALFALCLYSCGTPYPLPPTPCDDYCRVMQRAECDDDDPADCVRHCEASPELRRARASCAPAWQARNDCLAATEPRAFRCEHDHTRVPDRCLDERRVLAECLVPSSGFCFDECVRQAASCGGELPDCEASCIHQPPACQAASAAFNRCLQGYPVECHEPFAEDTRSLDQIPCLTEVGAALSCGD
ncbi:MAG TPA: hypothetical protein VEQ59_05090 [Polyangiaceae bacterium]|nr:hypothetical protein [Polyangiaceae bacterium]